MFKKIKRLILGQKYIDINSEFRYRYLNLLPIAGYIILALTIVDYSFYLLNVQITEPYSQFEIIGNLVERIWSPLLGCLLIFYPREKKISLREKMFLNVISWAVLTLALFYILMIPLIFFNGNRINNDLQLKFEQQLTQQQVQLQQFDIQLKNTPDQQLLNLAKQQSDNLPVVGSADQIRYQLLASVKAEQTKKIEEAKSALNQQKIKVKTSSIKWIIGAILSAFILINIWDYSNWTRI